MKRILIPGATIANLVLVMSLAAWAQRSTATILGLLTDATGAVVPGVAVTLTNTETGLVRSVNTGGDGLYTITDLPIGTYTITASKEGFRKAQVVGVVLHVDENRRVDVSLTLGAVTQQVSVTAQTSLLKTDTPTVSQVVVGNTITEMPLNGRNFQELALLTPGVVVGSDFYGGTGYFTGLILFSVNGTHPDKTEYSFDGGDVSEQEIGGPTFTPPIDSITEFSVMSGQFSAEFGHGGGVINLATKSGTNAFHGTLWEFLRNDKAAARNFFAVNKPPLKRNQYGPAIGGPLRRDRTFFFASFEGTNLRTGVPFVSTVPTAKMRTGDFSELLPGTVIYNPATTRPDPNNPAQFIRDPFLGNMIPSGSIASVAQYFNAMAIYPVPNQPGLVNNYLTNGASSIDTYIGSMRIDHRLTEKDTLFGRYSQFSGVTTDPGPLYPSPLGETETLNRAINVVLDWVHTFSPTVLLEARVNVNRNYPIATSPISGIKDYTQASGIQGFQGISNTSPGYPNFTYSGYAEFNGLTYNPNERTNTGFNYGANLTLIRNKHSFKFGTEIRRWNYTFWLAGDPRGGFAFDGRYTNNPETSAGGNSYADFLLGLPYSGDRYRATDRFYYTLPDYHFYAQDDFKILPRLTLSYGLRYDLILPTRSRRLNMSNFDPSLVTPSGLKGAIVVPSMNAITNSDQAVTPIVYPLYQSLIDFADKIPGYPFWLVNPNLHNLAPRLGFSWRPFEKNPLVVRGGYGIFYENPNGNIQSVYATTPFLAREEGTVNSSPIPTRTLQEFFGAASYASIPTLTGLPRTQPTPYDQQFSFGLEYQLTPTLMIDSAYVGDLGRHFEALNGYNVPQPGPGDIQSRRPFPQFSSITMYGDNWGTSNYHAWQTKVEKRLSHGLTFLSSYTLSKQLGTSFNAYSGVQDPYHKQLDYGLSNVDATHNFTTSVNYQLPGPNSANRLAKGVLGGWELGAIVSAHSGLPFTVGASGDPANTGQGSRPDRLASGKLANPTIQGWFDPTAFAPVPAGEYRYGDSGVNILRGPHFVNLDFSVYKNFETTERLRWQFRAEFFNLMNHPNFGQPFSTIGYPGLTGAITSASSPRIIQFGLKMYF